jgi:hypothetical protein
MLGHEKWSGTGLMGCKGIHFLNCMITADKLERAKIFTPAHQLRHSLMNLGLAFVAGVPLSSVFRSSPQLSTELSVSNGCLAWTPAVLSLEPVHWNKYGPAQFS